MSLRILSILLILALMGCKEGKLAESSVTQSFSQESITLLDYNATHLNIYLKGSILATGVEGFHKIIFYDNPGCAGEASGESTAQVVQQTGVSLQVEIKEEISLYYTSNNGSQCEYALTHKISIDPVPVPTLTRTSPKSPSRNSTTVAVLGEAFPDSGTVELYVDPLCTTAVATGSTASFKNPGILVEVNEDAFTPIAVRMKDPRGVYSECETLLEFEHRSELASEIEFLTTVPLSPSNTVSDPVIKGRTQSTIAQVILFSDAACTNSLGQVSSNTFEASGLQVTLGGNSTTSIYARGLNEEGSLTACFFLTEYIHDDQPPGAPTYLSASPNTPTNQTTFPKLIGTAPADAAVVRLFSDSFCNQVIGFGSKATFASTGVTANLPANNTTSIFATSLDSGGNESDCVFFLNYKHNTIPPEPPLFQTSVPTSPTNITAVPALIGTPSLYTSELFFYNDVTCTNLVGQGSPTDFQGAGISVTLQENTNNFIYSIVRDIEGNFSDCTELTNFDHSNLPALNPVFTTAYPTSPTRLTTTPSVAGTADITVTTIDLFLDSGCATVVKSGSRGNFSAAGIPITVNANAVTAIYAKSNDIYGNQSTCQLLTNYTHTTIPPLDPTFTVEIPASPNNTSYTPNLFGNAFTNMASPIDPVNVIFYDNPVCVGSLGQGTPAAFSTTGITINVPPNAPSSIYARSFDAAGNGSACTYLTDYIHNTLTPGEPLLSSLSPGTPSYTPLTHVTGTFAASADFMSRVSVIFYSDNLCTNQILTTTPNIYETVGIDVPLTPNTVTPLSAASFNGVGNKSACSQLVNFNTYDTPPSGLATTANLNGSIRVFWNVDTVANPQPNYILKRATQSGGPYTQVFQGSGSSYQDNNVNEGVTYYYVIQAINSTGQTLNSAEVARTVNAPSPVAAATLLASPSNGSVTLTWSGFPQNLSYNVYRGTQSGGPYTQLIEGQLSNSYTSYGLTNNQAYFFVVKGFNPEGESLSSNEIRSVPRSVPLAPSNIWLKPMTSIPECSNGAGIWVQWTEPSHFDGFRLARINYGGSNSAYNITQSYYVDCSIGNNTLEYEVESKWGSYISSPSSRARYEPGQTTLFVQPGDGLVNLKWNAPGAADTIDIFRSTKATGPFDLYTSQANIGNYQDTGVVNGEAYFYYLQARDGATTYVGLPSDVLSGIPGAAPNAPSNLMGMNPANSVDLTWTPSTHFNEFRVYRSANIGGPYSQIGTTTIGAFSDYIPFEGLNHYRVTALWGSLETAPSNTFTFRKAKVLNLTATNGATDIQLNWTAYSGASAYNVERSISANGPWTGIAVPSTNTLTDATAVSGESYYYRVRANFADATSGQYSSIVSGRRTDSSVPGGITITSQSTNSLGLSWVAVPGASSYDVELATAPGGPYSLAATTTGTSAALSGLNARTLYYLRVKSLVGVDTFISASIQGTTLGVVAAPSGYIGNNLVDLQWTSSIGFSSYTLQRSTDGINFSTLVTSLVTNSYTDATATNGQVYFYRVVHVYDGVGTSVSEKSVGLTPGLVPLSPAGLTVVKNSTGIGINLSWARSTNASQYGVYMATSSGGPYVLQFNSSSYVNVPISGLTTGQLYFFKVSAISGTNESALSNYISTRPTGSPAAPTVSWVSSTEIQLDWSSVTYANSYDVYRTEDKYVFEKIATGVVTTDYLDNTADPDKIYHYFYQPIAATGEFLSPSDLSARIGTGTTIHKPTGVTIVSNAVPEVTVQWAPVSQAQNYQVYRSLTSGGGFSLSATVSTPTVTWTDTTVSNGQTYFYKIRALNSFTVPSADSDEVNIALVAAPTGLAASNNGSNIDLIWNSIAGASQYVVYRSLEVNGNYGAIGTSGSTSFSDTDTSPGVTYHYKVSAELAGPTYTPLSSSTSLLKTGSAKLAIPVELIDRSLASLSTGDNTFERSQTSFNTQYYDGTVTYALEIVATNADGVVRNVTLVDAADADIVSIGVPSTTLSPTRMLQSFTPAAGAQQWRIKLEQTGSDEDLSVSQARVIVYQQDATKTALYIPLLSSNLATSSEDTDAWVAVTDSDSLVPLVESLPYMRETDKLEALIPLNPWALEVVVASDAGVTGEVSFYNIDQDEVVGGSITEFDQTIPTLVNVPLGLAPNHFSLANDNEAFGVSLRCQLNCNAGQNAKIYKAGLWVRLENLRKAQVTWRTSLGTTIPAASTVLNNQRTFVNLNDYDNPQVFWQVSMNGSESVQLGNAGSSDVSSTGLSTVTNSTLTGSGSGFQEVLRTPAISPTSGDRYMLISNPASPLSLSGSQLIINSEL